jgi:hypothetical protein
MLPGTLESLAGGSHGDVDILLCSLLDGDNRLFVVRIDGLEGASLYSSDELIVDEPMPEESERSFHRGSKRQKTGEERGVVSLLTVPRVAHR